MRLLRYLLPAIIACGFSSVFADDCQRVNGVTPVLLREYINSKRTIPLDEKDCNIIIAGDVRTIWAHSTEKLNGTKLRGSGSAPVCTADGKHCGPFPANDFDIIFDLYFDYSCDRSWGVAWLQFDNPCGIERSSRDCTKDPDNQWGSGRCDGLCLKKAYWGYNLIADGCNRFDIEVGRRPLYTIFDSYVQFRSRFDGVLLRYAAGLPDWGTFYINGGAFIIDEKVNHFGYVAELGIMNIAEIGWDVKYSFIDWRKRGGFNRCGVRRPEGSNYQISQVTLYYYLDPYWCCMPVNIFGAYLWNHATSNREIFRRNKYNQAWYVGITAGEVCHAGDWAAQLLYIVAQPRSVPDFDVYYIGNGNILCESFTEGTDLSDIRGNANFVGWRLEFLYGFTDNLSLDAFLEFSRPYTTRVGGRHDFSRVQLEGIYAF